MTFTKINDINNDNIHNRACVMVVNFNKKEGALIKNICGFNAFHNKQRCCNMKYDCKYSF